MQPITNNIKNRSCRGGAFFVFNKCCSNSSATLLSVLPIEEKWILLMAPPVFSCFCTLVFDFLKCRTCATLLTGARKKKIALIAKTYKTLRNVLLLKPKHIFVAFRNHPLKHKKHILKAKAKPSPTGVKNNYS